MDQNIEIAVRIKPCSTSAISALCSWDSRSIQVTDRNLYSFDSVIEPNASQQSVYEKIGMKIISNVLEGYNGCIFAYGQTGSGKTYTMTGYQGTDGIIQRCLRTLWNCVRKSEFFQIKLGYFQIYNETIKDLLSERENLTIRQNAKTGFYVENLTEKVVQSYLDFEQLINHGISVRTVKQTKMNQVSSRSHSVLEVNVSFKRREQNSLSVLKHAKITFIDLAGSEKQKQTQVEGQRLKQAANINKSLSTLSLVISKLSQQSQRKSTAGQAPIHIPFRNSVLTRILKNSLTGKSKIIIVCTVSLQQRFIDETISTLRFAQTAKSIKMKVNKNEQEYDGSRERLFEEFREFKQKFNQLKDTNQDLGKENQELKRENAYLKDQLERKQAEINQLQVSMQCMKLQSQHIFHQIRSQSQMQSQQPYSTSQPRQMYRSQTQLSQNQSYNNFRNSQHQSQQVFNQPSFSSQFQNPQQSNYFNLNQENYVNPVQQPSQGFSQLSFFNSHLSSDVNSQKNSFFTIQEEDSKQEHSGTSSNGKLHGRIRQLEAQINKLKLQNEFLKFDMELQQHDILQLTKKTVVLQIAEHRIQQANKLFAQLVQNQQFSHAQLKFLDLCLKNHQKDKLALELAQEQKKNQKARFNQAVQKIKNLLINFTENQRDFPFQQQTLNDQFLKQKSSQMFKSPIKKQKVNSINDSMKSDELFSSDIQVDKQNYETIQEKVKQTQSFNKKRSMEVEDYTMVKGSQTPMNDRQPSQAPFLYAQSSQFLRQPGYQSSQQAIFMQDNRSLRSQTSNKLSNNELEYLKKDYQKMAYQVKELREQVQKGKLLLMEKDSLLEQKQFQLEQNMNTIKMLDEDLETQKHLLEIQKKKHQQKDNFQYSLREIELKLMDKNREVQCLKQYLSQVQRKNQAQNNTLRLKNKDLQLTIQNYHTDKQHLLHQHNQQINQYVSQVQKLNQQLLVTRKEKEQIQIEYGVINSQNALLTERYNYLKSCTKNNNQAGTPKKMYSKRSSFYSISQQQQTPQHQSNKVNTQNNTSIAKPKQLTQQQCIQVIQNKTLKYMYQAAYYFYKKYYSLQDVKTTYEQRISSIQNQMKTIAQKYEAERHKLTHQLLDAKKQALSHKQIVVDLKHQVLQLKRALYEKQKIIDRLESNQKHAIIHSQLLETKLKQKNQKQLQAKQKAHNLSAQLRDNSLTPNYIDKNNRFNFGIKRFSNQSEDSLISNGDTPNLLTEINPSNRRMSTQSRKSIQLARRQVDLDQLQQLRGQIQELSNESTLTDHILGNQEREYSATQSLVSHTANNQLQIQQPINNNHTNYLQLQEFEMNQSQNNQNKSKAATTKGHFQLKSSNHSKNFQNLFNNKSKR